MIYLFFLLALSTVSQQGRCLASWLIFRSEGWQLRVATSQQPGHGLRGGSGSGALLGAAAATDFNIAVIQQSHEGWFAPLGYLLGFAGLPKSMVEAELRGAIVWAKSPFLIIFSGCSFPEYENKKENKRE